MTDQYRVAHGWPIDPQKMGSIINDADGLAMWALSAHQEEARQNGTTIWQQEDKDKAEGDAV